MDTKKHSQINSKVGSLISNGYSLKLAYKVATGQKPFMCNRKRFNTAAEATRYSKSVRGVTPPIFVSTN